MERCLRGWKPWSGSVNNGLKHILFDHFYHAERPELFKRELPIIATNDLTRFDYASLRSAYFKDSNPDKWVGKKLILLDETRKVPINFPSGTSTTQAPFSPDDYEFQVEQIFIYHKYLNEIINTDDLLLWNERETLDNWFSGLFRHVAVWKGRAKPYDRDHLVPSDFFNYVDSSTVNSILAANLSRLRLPIGTDWHIFKTLRNSIGNKHLLPTKLNRSAQNSYICKKLSSRATYSGNHPLHASVSVLSHSHWQKLSILSSTWPLWIGTPVSKTDWSLITIGIFLEAIRQRRKELYEKLYDFVV